MKLTPAEIKALEAYRRGYSYKAAAHALGRSQHTVTRQLASARAKLGASSSMEAADRLGEKPAA